MNKIMKYEYKNNNFFEIPKESVFLNVHYQNSKLYFYFEVDESKDIEEFHFKIFEVNDSIPYNMGIDFKFLTSIEINSTVYFIYKHIF